MISFVADVHVGNHRRHGGPSTAGINERARMVLDALRGACDQSREQEDEGLVILGDLFDAADPTPQLIAAVQGCFTEGPDRIHVLRGNHDMVSAQDGDHALGPLYQFECVSVVERPERRIFSGADLFLVPFEPGDAREWFPKRVTELANQTTALQDPPLPRVLGFHLGIEDEDTAPFMRGKDDAIPVALLRKVMKQHRIEWAFAGNWHSHRSWALDETTSARIFQVGALAPTGWDNPGLDGYGRLVTWSPEEPMVRIREIGGPRFLDAKDGREATKLLDKMPPGCTGFMRVQAEATDRNAVAKAQLLAEALRGEGHRVEIDLRTGVAEEKAAKAARSARSASTLDEALARYVREMPQAAGPTQDEILAKCREYLKPEAG